MHAMTMGARPEVPARAGVLSLAALLVPLVAELIPVGGLAEYEMFLWLLALVPPFLWAYYRGWRGAASALAAGMAVLSLGAGAAAALGRPLASWQVLLAVTSAYVAVSLGVGLVTELLHRERQEAERRALLDPLTELPNRRLARLVLEQEFAAAERGRPLTVVMWDLDHFKRYNDAHGHEAGDLALQAFAEALRTVTRRMNLSARYGGEEFVSVLGGCTTKGAMVMVERVRWLLRQAQLPGGPVQVSAGVAQYDGTQPDADALLAAADRALYRAKAEGRNGVRVHQGPLRIERIDEAELELGELAAACA